jgi:hypothetical protein
MIYVCAVVLINYIYIKGAIRLFTFKVLLIFVAYIKYYYITLSKKPMGCFYSDIFHEQTFDAPKNALKIRCIELTVKKIYDFKRLKVYQKHTHNLYSLFLDQRTRMSFLYLGSSRKAPFLK